MVIVADGAINEYLVDTAIGTPILCPPPNINDTVGFDMLEIISAIARPASTSPPTVFSTSSSPSMFGSSSIATSCGITCSYFVVLFCGGNTRCPSIWPIIVRQCMFLPFSCTVTVPISFILLILSFSLSGFLSSAWLTKNTFDSKRKPPCTLSFHKYDRIQYEIFIFA